MKTSEDYFLSRRNQCCSLNLFLDREMLDNQQLLDHVLTNERESLRMLDVMTTFADTIVFGS